MVSSVRGIAALCVWRGDHRIGHRRHLAANNAVAAEFSNARRRDLCVSLMAIGYPWER